MKYFAAINSLKDWYRSRETREQTIIVICSILLLVILVHMIIWTPLSTGYIKANSRLYTLRNDVLLMRAMVPKIKMMQKRQQNPGPENNSESLQTVINRTARIHNLQNTIRQIIPSGLNKIQVTIKDVEFNTLIQWLETIKTRHQINIITIAIEKNNKREGIVNVRIVINRTPA